MDTFVVQVWAPADGAPTTGLRGMVRDIATGIERPFRNADEVLHLLRRDVRFHTTERTAEK